MHGCGFGLYSCNTILHAMCFQFCLHRDIHKKCIPIDLYILPHHPPEIVETSDDLMLEI